jgi:hypothetical protein
MPSRLLYTVAGRQGLATHRLMHPLHRCLLSRGNIITRALTALVPLALLSSLSCDSQPGDETVGGFPPRLDDLAEDLDALPSYEPAFPLWTNGSAKHRFILTPDGSPAQHGAIPEGTLFFKQFEYDGVFVETRVIRVTAAGPEYAVYLHPNGSAQGAQRMEQGDPREVPVELDGESFTHVIPHATQCAACHEAGMGPILGFTELQLAGFADDEEDEAEELQQEVIGYAQGNCVHCHNGSGVAGASFDMRVDAFVANTVGVPTEGSASAAGVRVVPGDPDTSVLYQALLAQPPAAPMPPLGVQRRDEEAANRVRAWIQTL